MTISVTAFLADSAEAVAGKLYILGGGWDTVATASVPTVQTRVAVAALIHIGWNDTDREHEITVRLETEDGLPVPLSSTQSAGSVLQLGHRFTASRSGAVREGDDQTHPVTFTIQNLHIERAGGYSWVLEVDGAITRRLPMRVLIRTS